MMENKKSYMLTGALYVLRRFGPSVLSVFTPLTVFTPKFTGAVVRNNVYIIVYRIILVFIAYELSEHGQR